MVEEHVPPIRKAASEAAAPHRKRFWARQFSLEATRAQTIFDITFGILLPIGCLVADPFVFRDGWRMGAGPLLGRFTLFSYTIILLSAAGLAFWLWSRLLSSFVAGVLFAGFVFSGILGLVLIPFSLLGTLFFGIGLLGLTPLLTAFVYYRNCRRLTANLAQQGVKLSGPLVLLAACGVFVSGLALQLGVDGATQWSIDAILHGEKAEAMRAAETIRWLPDTQNLDDLVFAYDVEDDPARKEILAEAYGRITGVDIETRLRVLHD